MKKYISTLIILSFSFSLFAQLVSIKAKAVDASSTMGVSYVNAGIWKDSALVTGSPADSAGVFIIHDVKPGKYVLKVSSLGYKDYTKLITITGKNTSVDLGNLLMDEDGAELKEVEVVSQASQMKFDIDKKVFSVSQSIAAEGGNMTEVLATIPSVTVDTEGNVSLRNNANVEIWINGKPSGLSDENRGDALEQMPAESVESVEIITNPSSKYSPEGSAGIINIITKANRKAGYNGSVNMGTGAVNGYQFGQVYGGNINVSKGRVDGYLNLGYRNVFFGREADKDRYYFDNGDTTQFIKQDFNGNYNIKGINSRYGVNYNIDKRHVLGFAGNVTTGNRNSTERYDYLVNDYVTPAVSDYSRKNRNVNDRMIGKNELDYLWKVDSTGTELRTNLSMFFVNMDTNSDFLQTVNSGIASTLDQEQYNQRRFRIYQLKSDFTKKLSTRSKLESGIDLAYRTRNTLSETYNFDGSNYVEVPERYNKFINEEQIYAGYLSYSTRIKELKIQGGLRGEYTDLMIQTNTNAPYYKSYFELFPSAFVSYSLKKGNELQVNYTRRINRPRGNRLNSFVDISDSTNISYGNPDLMPEFASSFELNHIKTWKKASLSSSLYFKQTDNIIQSISFVESSVMNNTYTNVSKSQSSGIEFVAKGDPIKILNLTGTVNLFYFKLFAGEYEVTPTNIVQFDADENFMWNAKGIANIILSRKLGGQVSFNYTSPRTIAQGEISEQYSMDLGLRTSFFDKALKVSVSVSDVLNSKKDVRITQSESFYQYYYSLAAGPIFRVNATYSFGNNKKKKNANAKDKNGENTNEDENSPNGGEEF